jgi:GrpB-like predicted nucleotidyltransferase (UPF0157 family)
MIGLERGLVKLHPFTAEWRRHFEAEKALLQGAVGSYILDIQHVGSTSIPGMVAKPIVDIAIAVSDFEEARVCIQPIEGLGYEYKGENGIPRRHYFGKGDQRMFHLHLNEINSLEWQNLILFRDYLCRHPEAVQEYVVLKIQLAAKYPRDRQAYLDGKAPFIERVLQLARSGPCK